MKAVAILIFRYLVVALLGGVIFASSVGLSTGIVMLGQSNLAGGIVIGLISLSTIILSWHYICHLLDYDKDPI